MTVFPIHVASPLRWEGPPPTRADVVVIGGGVVGVTAALYLARAGNRVVLVEKGRIAGEQSSRNWGWIRQQGRDADELPLMIEANGLWRELAAETHVDIGLVQGGVTYVARKDGGMARFEAFMEHARTYGIDTRLLSATETHALLPGLTGQIAGAMHTPSDMRAEPWVAVPALAEIAAREGAVIVEDCAARALDLQAGRIAGVWTEAGHVAAPEVVLAGGAWSSLLLRRHGVFLPQLSVRSTAAATTRLPPIGQGGVSVPGIAFRPRADGGYTLAAGGAHELFAGPQAIRAFPKFLRQLWDDPFGTRVLPAAPAGYPDGWMTPAHWDEDAQSPFERMRILNPVPNRARLAAMRDRLAAIAPHLGPIHLRTAWAGMIDVMPDVVPVIDRVPALPGLTVGTGLSGHGFGIGPAVGKALAALVLGGETGHDLTRFRFGRFSDGSPIRPGPAL